MNGNPNKLPNSGRSLFGHWPWVAVAVLALGAASIALLIGNDRIHQRLVARDLILVCAIGDLQNEVAKAHLWMKEYVSGDETNKEEIWVSLDAARRGIDAVRHGGVIHENLKVPFPLVEPELMDQAGVLSADIDALKALARVRLFADQANENVGRVSPREMRLVDVFYSFSKQAHNLEMAIV